MAASAERQRQLLDLIGLWVGIRPPAAAERRLAGEAIVSASQPYGFGGSR